MTREEAISIMKVIVHMLEEKYDTDRVEDAVDMAIKALSAEPCEDCISRAEAIEALGYDISIESDEGLDAYKTVIKEMLCKIYDVQKENIEKLPSIKPKTDVLDKIRAEIEHLTITEGGEDYVRTMAELYSLKIKVLQIIDKYRTEREDKK